jgi:hypothetical protein
VRGADRPAVRGMLRVRRGVAWPGELQGALGKACAASGGAGRGRLGRSDARGRGRDADAARARRNVSDWRRLTEFCSEVLNRSAQSGK